MKQLLTAATALAMMNSTPAHADQVKSGMIVITRNGTQASAKGSEQFFSGAVRVDMLFLPQAPARTSAGLVTFEPGARTAWHTHPLGQILIVTAGKGWVQEWEREKREIQPGDVIWIPPGVEHWHGASATTAMSHIAIQEALDGKAVEWLEQVSDAQYGH